jgi:hypothetical protein
MVFFEIGLFVLFIMTAIFFVVFFSFIFYWHLVKTSYLVVPVAFTFEFLLAGFFIISVASIILQYLPDIVRASGL